MQFQDISQDKKETYCLQSNEKVVFFMFNRTGEVTFELCGAEAEAHIFSFFVGKGTDKATLKIFQKHSAPKTASHTLIKSVLFNEAEYLYEGFISIDKRASQSDASQESRGLLLSPQAKTSMKPVLEILTNDVRCRHAATASPLNPESLFFAETRGLSRGQASKLLIQGFFNEALERMEKLGVKTETIKTMLHLKLGY